MATMSDARPAAPTPASATLLTMSGISKRYGPVRALDDVDFDLRAGEVMALLGENGAGKSTLVKILSGLISPDAGQITLDGATVDLGSAARSRSAGIAVVQHIADGFTEGLASWLTQECHLKVREAADGEALKPGHVLLAPSGRHLLIGEGVVRLSHGPPVDTFKPSVTPLFLSAATAYGARACGVILTGMGHDGAAGLRVLHDAGGATLAQDEQSSAVFGMAKAAIDLGAVDRVLPLDEIPGALVALTS